MRPSSVHHARIAGALALVWLACFASCIPREVRVTLPEDVSRLSLSGGRGQEVVLFPVEDVRPERDGCGTRWNGRGRVRCTPPPPDWLSQGLLRSLDAAGYRVVTLDKAESADPYRIYLRLSRLEVGSSVEATRQTLSAQAEVSIRVESASGLRAARGLSVSARHEDPFGAPETLQKVVDDLAERLLTRTVDSLVELTERYPAVGVRRPRTGAEPPVSGGNTKEGT